MKVLDKPRVSELSEEQVISAVKEIGAKFNVTIKGMCINKETDSLVVLIDNEGDFDYFEVTLQGYLVGYFNDGYERIEDVRVGILDEECPEITVVRDLNEYKQYVKWIGGKVLDYE